MGAFLDKPKTEKYNESQAGAGLRYGLSSMQGWRIEMEDAHSALIGIPEIGDKARMYIETRLKLSINARLVEKFELRSGIESGS